jgi:ketosteroid isomerase-like protein
MELASVKPMHLSRCFVATSLLFACAATTGQRAAERQVNDRLAHYSELVRVMDHSGIAALFAPDGAIVNPGQAPIVGPADIEHFLSSFSGFKVLFNETVPTSTVINGSTAQQIGHYRQRVRTPGGQELAVSGAFTGTWIRVSSGPWLIQRMETTPDRR